MRLFAMDVDGVLTDGTVHISSEGSEAKAFSILDGHGLRQLAREGVAVALISTPQVRRPRVITRSISTWSLSR